jgi:hypothetical protein
VAAADPPIAAIGAVDTTVEKCAQIPQPSCAFCHSNSIHSSRLKRIQIILKAISALRFQNCPALMRFYRHVMLAAFKARFDIKGFPTILFFLDGHVYPFAGNRNVEGFRAFVTGGYKKVTPTEYKLSAAVAGSKPTPLPSDTASDSATATRISSPSQLIAAHPVAAFFGTCVLVALIVGLVATRRRRKSGARALIHDLESVTLSVAPSVSGHAAASKVN